MQLGDRVKLNKWRGTVREIRYSDNGRPNSAVVQWDKRVRPTEVAIPALIPITQGRVCSWLARVKRAIGVIG